MIGQINPADLTRCKMLAVWHKRSWSTSPWDQWKAYVYGKYMGKYTIYMDPVGKLAFFEYSPVFRWMTTRWAPTSSKNLIIAPLIGVDLIPSQFPICKTICRGLITPFIARRGPFDMWLLFERPSILHGELTYPSLTIPPPRNFRFNKTFSMEAKGYLSP